MAISPGENAETRRLAQDVGARGVAQLEAGLARIMGEMGANNRWLLGALVLLNGGGAALAAAEHGALAAKILESAISFLVVGAAVAVLAALVNLLGALLLSRQIGEASALWAQVAASGEIGDRALKAAGKVRLSGLLSSLVTLGLALIALILFVAGAMTLGSGLVSSEPAAPISLPLTPPAKPVLPPLPERTPIATPQSAPLEQAKPAQAPPPEAKPAPPPEKPTPRPEPRRRASRAESNPAPATSSSAPASAPATSPPPATGNP